MLRFAPSTTSDMHIDKLRVAIFNYIVARQRNEDFIVRIEDMDKEHNIEGKDQEILDLLALFGIEYSQVIYQSQNVRFHSAMALQLMHEKKAFSCFCSPNWLEKKRQEAKVAKIEYTYDDACRNLPAELVIDNTNPFTIRITRPDKPIIIYDKVQGDIKFNPDKIDSFIILNQDKIPTENFASAVDDMLSDISIIVRSEDQILNSVKQEHIRTSLEYNKKIEYAHLPCLVDSKSITVKWLLEEGYLPEAILNYLVSIGNKMPKEIFTMQEAIEFFKFSYISKNSIEFNIDTLKEINKAHLKKLDTKELSRYVGFADEEIGELARIYLDSVSTTKALKLKIAPIFEIKNIPKELELKVQTISQSIMQAPYFEEYNEFIKHISDKTGFKDDDLLKPLRLLLTNTQDGPDLSEIYKYLKNYLGEIVK